MKKNYIWMKSFVFLGFFSLATTVQAAQAEDHAAIVASAGPNDQKSSPSA